MDTQPIFELLTRVELLLWFAALVTALTGRIGRSFPAILWLISARVTSTTWYDCVNLAFQPGTQSYDRAFDIYYRSYWGLYFISTLATFFSIEQLLRSGFSQLPGLSRLAVLVFRFTGALCLFIALTAHLPVIGTVPWLLWLRALFISFQLCICAFEIALVSILLFNARRLGLTLRTRTFGLSVGFLLFGLSDVFSLLSSMVGNHQHPGFGLFSEFFVCTTVLLWVAYFIAPEGERGPLALKPSSTLMRWNEIVNQLGGGAAVLSQPATSFISEVELLVERIMVRSTGGGH